jgi:transcriptional regulator GlxA family with amidase domain
MRRALAPAWRSILDIAIIAFDNFTDLDLFLPWDLLNRVKDLGWKVRILGDKPQHYSVSGLTIPMHGPIEDANEADVVLFTSGSVTRQKYIDQDYLRVFRLDSNKQLIGSMCSGSLILGGLGLLKGKEATTYPTARPLLQELGVTVVDRSFVRSGNIATAAGCLAGVELASWVIEEKAGKYVRDTVMASVMPIGTVYGQQHS